MLKFLTQSLKADVTFSWPHYSLKTYIGIFRWPSFKTKSNLMLVSWELCKKTKLIRSYLPLTLWPYPRSKPSNIALLPFLLLLVPQLYLWGSPFWVRFLCMWSFFNPTIEVVTFRQVVAVCEFKTRTKKHHGISSTHWMHFSITPWSQFVCWLVA